MFEGFVVSHVQVADDVVLRVRHGGDGPPVLLLHGHPRTHVTWHRVAPLLARGFSVVCPDLRGYGRSTTPPPVPDGATQSKRAMAADVVTLMAELGHERFALVGHDRGAYVAHRCALDHPASVTRLAVLDGVPILEALERCDADFATRWWHWFFLARAETAVRVITADPDAWYELDPTVMGQEAAADVRRALHDPTVVRAMCDDYRAGLGPDRAADAADRDAGRQITCPVLVAWSTRDDLEELYDDPLAVWRPWVRGDLRGVTIPSGHHMAEEAPDALSEALEQFLV